MTPRHAEQLAERCGAERAEVAEVAEPAERGRLPGCALRKEAYGGSGSGFGKIGPKAYRDLHGIYGVCSRGRC